MKISIKIVVGLFLCCGLDGSLRVQSQTLPSRIIEAIDDDSVVRLENTTDIRIGTAADEGRVSPDLPMERMLLMLTLICVLITAEFGFGRRNAQLDA